MDTTAGEYVGTGKAGHVGGIVVLLPAVQAVKPQLCKFTDMTGLSVLSSCSPEVLAGELPSLYRYRCPDEEVA